MKGIERSPGNQMCTFDKPDTIVGGPMCNLHCRQNTSSFPSIRPPKACIANSSLSQSFFHLLVLRVLWISGLTFQCLGTQGAGAAITVTPTGYDVASTEPYIAWIDNHQFLFVGRKSNADLKKGSIAPAKTYIWNASTKSVREYSEATNFCYADGKVQYRIQKYDETGKATMVQFAGPLGAEAIVKESVASSSAWRGFNRFSCELYGLDSSIPPLPRARLHLALRRGDGYLILGPNDGKAYVGTSRNIMLYREKGASPVALPMTWDEEVGLWDTFYSAYLGAYVLHPQKFLSSEGPREWPTTEPRVVYKLYANSGKVERILLPKAEGFYRPRPIRDGWIHGGGNFYKTAGLYMNKSNVMSKLDTGNIKQIVVSPDGCQAAVAINNWHLDMGTPTTIKVFNVCK